VGNAFKARSSDEAMKSLENSDIAFARINDMEALSHHAHLRRITVETPNGPASIPAPAPIFKGEPRDYGPVPGLPIEGEDT